MKSGHRPKPQSLFAICASLYPDDFVQYYYTTNVGIRV